MPSKNQTLDKEIVDRFLGGASVRQLSAAYGLTPGQIEKRIRNRINFTRSTDRPSEPKEKELVPVVKSCIFKRST